MPYVPGTATVRRVKLHKRWKLAQRSAVFIPAEVRATRDLSEFYEKPPQEMSRYELEKLEKILKITDEEREAEEGMKESLPVMFDEDGNQLTLEQAWKTTDEYKGIQEQVRRLNAVRVSTFKQYWRKFKNNK